MQAFEISGTVVCDTNMPESFWHLSFKEEHLNMNWNGNLDSSIGKSARLVRIPVQVRIFVLNSKL
jgi:hypothetical protein